MQTAGEQAVLPRLLPREAMRELRDCFAQLRYSAAALQMACGTSVPPTRAARPVFLHATRTAEPLPALARAFLAGMPVPVETAAKIWPERFIALCREAGLLVRDGAGLKPSAVIVPLALPAGELLFASDALAVLGTSAAGDFVLPASTHAARYLLNLTIRRRVESALDLGTGCGVQALAAASHSGRIVATDVSARALSYTAFNAALNGVDNLECLEGSLFGPVAGRRFDLIVSNPPFVPGPGGQFGYRDAGMELDSLCREIIRQAPDHLNDGGLLQMLCEWVELEEQPWQRRIESWLERSSCDTWVLRSPPQSPASYAALRTGEVVAASQSAVGTEYGEWLAYFAARHVQAIHPGLVVMRRRRGRNWLHLQPLAEEPGEPAGEAIMENIAACDFLASCTRPEELLGAVLVPAPALELVQRQRREDGSWKPGPVRARRGGPLPMDASLDAASAAVLLEFDGHATARECLRRLANRLGADPTEFTGRSLPVLRFFVERGLLLPADYCALMPQR
jgi:hypothetical protein